jgi:alkylhydroperoxidase family enzyme
LLAWTETVTLVAETSVPDEAYAPAHIVFEERELLDLTIAIGVMNTYYRMAIIFQNTPQAALSASSIERDESPATGDLFR